MRLWYINLVKLQQGTLAPVFVGLVAAVTGFVVSSGWSSLFYAFAAGLMGAGAALLGRKAIAGVLIACGLILVVQGC